MLLFIVSLGCPDVQDTGSCLIPCNVAVLYPTVPLSCLSWGLSATLRGHGLWDGF
jgi:hypothetical protein